MRPERMRERVDAEAAAIILEDVLAQRRRERERQDREARERQTTERDKHQEDERR